MSPAANTAASAAERKVSSISRKPRLSRDKPVSPSQGAPEASVTQSASSNAIALPSSVISRPGSTRATGFPVTARILRSRKMISTRGRTDVERNEVVADRRMAAAQDVALLAVEADRLVMDQPRPGEARQPPQIDMAFIEAVMPGDIARQHARVRRLDITGDQRDANP